MNRKVFFLIFLVVIIGGSSVYAETIFPGETFGYGRTEKLPINFSEIPTVNSTDNWITSIGVLGTVNLAQFDNIAGTLTIDESHIELIGNDWWLRRDGDNSPTANINWGGFGINNLGSLDMTGDIDMDNGNIFNATEISLKDSLSHSSFLNITTDLAGGEESQINIINTNDFGYSGIRFVNSIGDEFFAGTFGRNISSIAFPNIVDGNESLSGIASVGGPVFIGTTNNDSIYLGGGPSASLLDTDFFLRINPILKSIEIQGDKLIRPVATGSIQTMVFESNIGVSEGETTFGFFATDINNNSIIQKLMQIGHNNSASVLGMNSQIVASKDYLTMPANIKAEFDNNTGSPIIEEWFDNITNCFLYEEYLQGLGLVPEGLHYFCDTTGRLVPQSILGDLSVVRGVVGHEGATLFENLDVIIRDNSTDVDIIGGRGLHIRRIRIEEIGVAPGENVNRLFADFEQELLDPFILITSGKASDEWGVVADEDNCPTSGDFCVHAGPSGGSAATIMESNITTSNTQDMNLTFTINTFEMSSGGLLTIDIKNSTTSNNLYTLSSTDVSDLSVNIAIPSQWNNLSLVTISASFLSTHPNRGDMWIDEIIVNGIASASTLQNVTREDGEICLSDGKSRGDGSNRCIYDIFWNDSSKTLNLPGNTTFDHVEEQDLNITRSVTLNGTQIFSWGDIPDFFKLNGSSIMQGNANFGGFDLFNIGGINFSGLIYGNASQMTGITKNIEETLIKGDNANGQNITGLGYLNVTGDMVVDGGLGPANLLIIADSDNANENDVATLSLSQDGGLINGYLGFLSSNDLVLDHTGVSGAWGLGFARNGVIQLGTDGDGNAYATNNMTADYFKGNASQMSGIIHVNTTPINGSFGFWNRNLTILNTRVKGDSLELMADITLGTLESGSGGGSGPTLPIVVGVLELSRDSGDGGFSYNSITDSGNGGDGSGGQSDISDTEWNTETTGGSGWGDLTDVVDRVYQTDFASAYDSSIGNEIVGDESVMHIISTNKYYKVKHTAWGSGGVGTFALEWQEIIVNAIPHILVEGDATFGNSFLKNTEIAGTLNVSSDTTLDKLTAGITQLGRTRITTGLAPAIAISKTSSSIGQLFTFTKTADPLAFFRISDLGTTDFKPVFQGRTTVDTEPGIKFQGFTNEDTGTVPIIMFESFENSVDVAVRDLFGFKNFQTLVMRMNKDNDLIFPIDNQKIFFGASLDASMKYDGTNMVFNSQETGSGDFVFENGNVGIGTTSPSSRLEVNGRIIVKLGDNGDRLRLESNNDDVTIAQLEANPMRFETAAVERMRIDSSGNVGIGTTSPVSKLHVAGDINATGTIIVENITLSNGAIIGGNSTCAFIFYNQTGSIINTMGC